MVWERDVTVENIRCRVVISDEEDTLLAAKAAGRVIVGYLGENRKGSFPMASPDRREREVSAGAAFPGRENFDGENSAETEITAAA